MRNRLSLSASFIFVFLSAFTPVTGAQSGTGTLDITARITPTGARPEPVRQFVFYVLTKSYADIQKEISDQFPLASREDFIANLKVSPELKAWMKAHDVIDLTAPDNDKLFTPDDIIKVPELFDAYERSNSGGVTLGLPRPKYRDSDKEANPARYQKEKEDFMQATKKFIVAHPSTASGMETELTGVNPKYQWDRALSDHNRKVAQMAPDVAQQKYLASKADTDLEGHFSIPGLQPGQYWISSLGMDAVSGDRRLTWDVPTKVAPGQVTRLELNNVNGSDLNPVRP
jgi:hypothetical protein